MNRFYEISNSMLGTLGIMFLVWICHRSKPALSAKTIAKTLIFILSAMLVFSILLVPDRFPVADPNVKKILLAFVMAADFIWLFWLIMHGERKQAGKPFKVKVRKPDGSVAQEIEVRSLGAGISKSQETIQLSCETLNEGIDHLSRQLSMYRTTVLPDLDVGINAVGMQIASSLSRLAHDHNRGLLGYIMTRGDEHSIYDEALPRTKKGIVSILVVDSVVKNGNSLRNVCERLKAHYGTNIDIKICVLIAGIPKFDLRKLPVGLDMGGLLIDNEGSFKSANKEFLPHFLAFVANKKVTYPPLKIDKSKKI